MKVKFFGADRVRSSIYNLLKNLPPVLYQVIGRNSVRYIQEQTAKGYSVAQGDKPVPLKPLSSSWIEKRQKLSAFNRTAKDYAPSKSNLTFTGQLLKSLKFSVQGRRVSVFAEGPRRPYKTSRGGRPKSAPDNSQVAKYVSEERPFIGLDEQGKQMVRRLVVDELKRQIRKSGFRK